HRLVDSGFGSFHPQSAPRQLGRDIGNDLAVRIGDKTQQTVVGQNFARDDIPPFSLMTPSAFARSRACYGISPSGPLTRARGLLFPSSAFARSRACYGISPSGALTRARGSLVRSRSVVRHCGHQASAGSSPSVSSVGSSAGASIQPALTRAFMMMALAS